MAYIVAGTGCRSLATQSFQHKQDIAYSLHATVRALQLEHHDLVLMSGMAEGWDEAIAWIAIHLHIPLIAAVPNRGYGAFYWGEHSYHNTDRLTKFLNYLKQAQEVVYVCESIYENGLHANFHRNQYMVDRANEFLVYDPTSRGTSDCVRRINAAGKKWTEIK